MFPISPTTDGGLDGANESQKSPTTMNLVALTSATRFSTNRALTAKRESTNAMPIMKAWAKLKVIGSLRRCLMDLARSSGLAQRGARM